jgi:hypothetical protein
LNQLHGRRSISRDWQLKGGADRHGKSSCHWRLGIAIGITNCVVRAERFVRRHWNPLRVFPMM